MKKILVFLTIILMLAVLPVVAACAQPTPKGPIKIGVLYCMTGGGAMMGEHIVRAVKLGFEDVGYEVAGRKIELIVEDTATDPAAGLDKAKKLVENDKVCMIIGPLLGQVNAAVSPYMERVGIPNIATHETPIPQTQVGEHKWVFSLGAQEQMFSSMGAYAYEHLGIRTVTIMTEDTDFGHAIMDAFKAPFIARGGKVIQEQYSPLPTMDYGPLFSVLEDADALAAYRWGEDVPRFFTQWYEFGVRNKMPLLAPGAGGFLGYPFLAGLPPEVTDAMVGIYTCSPFSEYLDNDLTRHVVKVVGERWGEIPESDYMGGYTGAQFAIEALKATGGDTTPEKLRDAILGLDLVTCQGRMFFDPAVEWQVVTRPMFILKIDLVDGEKRFVLIDTIEDVPPEGKP